jgi:hypothetical protein
MLFGEFRYAVAIAFKVADYPEIPHGIAWGGYLGMVFAIPYQDGVSVLQDAGLRTYGGKAETLPGKETVMVNFRLGVMVWRVT